VRVGVVGHRGYVGLPAILGTLLDIAPELGLQLAFEEELWEIAEEGERLEDPEQVDALLTLGGDGRIELKRAGRGRRAAERKRSAGILPTGTRSNPRLAPLRL